MRAFLESNIQSRLKSITTSIYFSLSLLISLFLVTSTSIAFVPIAESGEIVKSSTYQVGVLPMFLSGEGTSGAELLGFFDFPYTEESTFRAYVGTGNIDFIGGLTFKYVPFPDVANQPAIGFRSGLLLSSNRSVNSALVEFAPLFSKKVHSDIGPITPYVALPLHLVSGNKNYVATTMAFGSDWFPESIQDYFFNAELGINLKDSYSYVSFAVTLPFDRKQGVRVR